MKTKRETIRVLRDRGDKRLVMLMCADEEGIERPSGFRIQAKISGRWANLGRRYGDEELSHAQKVIAQLG